MGRARDWFRKRPGEERLDSRKQKDWSIQEVKKD
jgi:hypothetical protein